MFRFAIVFLFTFALILLVAANNQHTKGYKKVPSGAISHCGVNTGQQCFKVESKLNHFSILTEKNLDIACDPSGLCVLPFNFDQRDNKAFFIGNCLNSHGEISGSAVNVTLGFRSISAHSSSYASFILKGNLKAKWESNKVYTTSVSVVDGLSEGESRIIH